MIPFAVLELRHRYSEEYLIAMEVYEEDGKSLGKKSKIGDLKKIMQDYEDNLTCSCNGKASRGPNCKCKKAEIFKLHVTEVKQWRKVLDKE